MNAVCICERGEEALAWLIETFEHTMLHVVPKGRTPPVPPGFQGTTCADDGDFYSLRPPLKG
jgi:hypothetical protein